MDYEQKNYSKALDAVENSVESDPNYGMAWYNKACYLSLLNQVPESLEALKRSIEIDVKNARKAVKGPGLCQRAHRGGLPADNRGVWC